MYKLSIIFLLSFLIIMTGCSKEPKETPVPQETKASNEVEYYINETVGYKVPITKSWKTGQIQGTDLLLVNIDGTFTPEPSVNIITTKQNEYDVWDKDIQKKLKKEISDTLTPALEENITVSGKHAYHLVYGLENDAVSKIVSQTYLFHNGYSVLITCAAREAEFNRFNDIFTKLINDIIFEDPKPQE